MDYNVNAPGEEGLQQNIMLQYQYMGYKPVYKRSWFWITVAAAIICIVVVTALLVSGTAPGRYELTGNAGVVAAYDFFCSEQESQEKLAGPLTKELGERLNKEPFEIQSEIKMNPQDTGESSFSLFNNITIGLDVKYDMKDLGVKMRAMGMEFIGGYLIDDNIVVSMMGQTGSMKVNLPKDVNITKNMGLQERIDTFLPFLNDEAYLSLLEKFAHSVPDKYTAADTEEAYSPKDDKEVRMDVIKTTLDSKAIKEVILKLADGIKDDKKLSRQLQDMIDRFTALAGLESYKIDDLIKELQIAADSEALKDVRLSWSVYKRHDSFAGIGIEFSGKDTNVKYTYMCEYDGNECFTSTVSELNGVKSETKYEYRWQGNKVKLSGEASAIVSVGTGNTTELIDGTIEFSKNGGNEYTLTGDVSIKGDVYSDILNSANSMSYDMKIDATVTVGGGLGTLKDDRDWNGIYKKEWGSMKDIFNWFNPGSDLFYYGDGNNV